jgi:hypothetical protein
MATPRQIAKSLLNIDNPIDVAGVLSEAAEIVKNPSGYTTDERHRTAFVLCELGKLFKRHAKTP